MATAKSIIGSVDNVVGGTRTLARIVGAVESAVAPSAVTTPPPSELMRSLGAPRDVKDGAMTLGGAGIGFLFGPKKHRVLSAIGGASLGRNVPALLHVEERKIALRNLLATGLGIGGSLLIKSHPILGFFGGLIGGGIAAHYAGLK